MNISIQTTADRMVVRDLDAGTTLAWVDTVTVEYDTAGRRPILLLGTYANSTIEVVSAPPTPIAPAKP